MTGRLNIISIFCNLSLDIISDSKKTDIELIFKNHINSLFNVAYKYIGQTNRLILTTDNGAAIAYTGAPEDAMLIATDILNGILMANKQGAAPLSVCIGIHLEPVQLVNDFNEQSNIIGKGINAAKKLMSQAKRNEILVSRSYYENIPPSTQALSTLFNDLDKNENHVIQYQAYLVGLNQNQLSDHQPLNLDPLMAPVPSLPPSKQSRFLNTNRLKYALTGLFVLVALIWAAKLIIAPAETHSNVSKMLPLKASQSSLKAQAVEPKILSKIPSETPRTHTNLTKEKRDPADLVKPAVPKKEAKLKTKSSVNYNAKESKTKESNTKKTISWETLKNSMKQGQKNACTQAEIAMNQCSGVN